MSSELSPDHKIGPNYSQRSLGKNVAHIRRLLSQDAPSLNQLLRWHEEDNPSSKWRKISGSNVEEIGKAVLEVLADKPIGCFVLTYGDDVIEGFPIRSRLNKDEVAIKDCITRSNLNDKVAFLNLPIRTRTLPIGELFIRGCDRVMVSPENGFVAIARPSDDGTSENTPRGVDYYIYASIEG